MHASVAGTLQRTPHPRKDIIENVCPVYQPPHHVPICLGESWTPQNAFDWKAPRHCARPGAAVMPGQKKQGKGCDRDTAASSVVDDVLVAFLPDLHASWV